MTATFYKGSKEAVRLTSRHNETIEKVVIAEGIAAKVRAYATGSRTEWEWRHKEQLLRQAAALLTEAADRLRDAPAPVGDGPAEGPGAAPATH